METLKTRYQAVLKSLKTLEHSLEVIKNPAYKNLHNELRDSIIKRFEFSIDTFWKYLKEYLEIEHKITVAIVSPKAVSRECLNATIITNGEFNRMLKMIDDRNLTSHTYNALLAEEITITLKNITR